MSLIDGMPLGDLSWWPDHIAEWDTEAAFLDVLKYYEDGIGVGVEESEMTLANSLSIYPNPAENVLNINSENELSTVKFYNVTGQMVMEVELNGVFSKEMDISTLDIGLYVIQVQDVTGEMNAIKFLKQ
jgi:hypothetical protein